MTAVETVAQQIRQSILAGERPAGSRLVEAELTTEYGVARHSLRAALRVLAGEGIVVIETNRGARVARLTAEAVVALYELRTALAVLERACADGAWGAINDAHNALHRAIVAAADSPRIAAAHAALDGELKLFMNQLEPLWSRKRMAADHIALMRGLERDGPAVLRAHLGESAAALVAAERDPGRRGRVGDPAAR